MTFECGGKSREDGKMTRGCGDVAAGRLCDLLGDTTDCTRTHAHTRSMRCSAFGVNKYIYRRKCINTISFLFEHLNIMTLYLSPSHTGLTTKFRPPCFRKMLESWTNRTQNVRLVAEVVGDRQGKISRSKNRGHVQNF